jgi:hypothetical protein
MVGDIPDSSQLEPEHARCPNERRDVHEKLTVAEANATQKAV